MMKLLKKSAFIIALLAAAVFVLQLVLNFETPYIADDLPYKRILESEAGPLLEKIVRLRAHFYFTWDGRVFGHSISSLFLSMNDKLVFNLCNSFVYTLLTLLIYLLAKPASSEHRPGLYIVGVLALWFFAPRQGETALSLTGSCNYLWGMTFIFALILPYKTLAANSFSAKKAGRALSALSCIGIFLLGLISGWYMENSSAAAAFFLMLFLLYAFKKKRKLPAWCYSGFAGAAIGFAFLVLAPGSRARAGLFDQYSPLLTLVSRIVFSVQHLVLIAVPLLVFALLFAKKYTDGEERELLLIPALLFLASMAANFSMIAAPTYPDRSVFPVAVFAICAALAMLYLFNIDQKYLRAAKVLLLSLLLLGAVDYSFALMDIMCANAVSSNLTELNTESPYYGKVIAPMTDHSPYTLETAEAPPAYDNWGAVMRILINEYRQS
ncbi:MAG: DUF6056 family protein [Oscillospiraceae bacterium]|nr:DUF6056 family protein [Oscillospiraceae bacterium]